MYSSCLFCHADLGRNEAVEIFPLGRRLAYDGARGRLWIVCPRCRGWNLTPLEERWEAIEACERLYRDTRLRVSTDQIGLARLPDGTELIRIGEPQRPEFAAWRYGERLRLRRRSTALQVGGGLAVVGGIAAGGIVAGIGIGGFSYVGYKAVQAIILGNPEKVITRLPNAQGELVAVQRKHLDQARLLTVGDRFELHLRGTTPAPKDTRDLLKGSPLNRTLVLEGDQAVQAATSVLPAVNRFGGTARDVQDAVRFLELETDPHRLFARLARSHERPLGKFQPRLRLALEMAAHEQTERAALEGELATLEAAWREAEEIASISDNMFVPPSVDSWISRIRNRSKA